MDDLPIDPLGDECVDLYIVELLERVGVVYDRPDGLPKFLELL